MGTAVHNLRTAPLQSVPGAGLHIVYLSRADAKELRRQVTCRANRNALQMAIDSEADPTYLRAFERSNILNELTAPTPEALRKVGAL
jgi:hypothetical protein